MVRYIRFDDLSPEERHALCESRVEPYDLLPPKVRAAISESKWGAPVDEMWNYVYRLRRGESEDTIIENFRRATKRVTERMYQKGVLHRECGDV